MSAGSASVSQKEACERARRLCVWYGRVAGGYSLAVGCLGAGLEVERRRALGSLDPLTLFWGGDMMPTVVRSHGESSSSSAILGMFLVCVAVLLVRHKVLRAFRSEGGAGDDGEGDRVVVNWRSLFQATHLGRAVVGGMSAIFTSRLCESYKESGEESLRFRFLFIAVGISLCTALAFHSLHSSIKKVYYALEDARRASHNARAAGYHNHR